VEFKLFKSANRMLDAIETQKPDLVGLSNYTWNLSLSAFVGRSIKKSCPSLPIIMGGPNISIDTEGIEGFLRSNEYVDTYCMYQSEISVYKIISLLLTDSEEKNNSNILGDHIINGCYSIINNKLFGNSEYEKPNSLDDNGSPYLTGMMDPFLREGCIPLVETNRGCPFGCTYCYWGVTALNNMSKYSMDRVKSELTYIANVFNPSHLYLADANFGILPRDVEIAQHMRDLYDQTNSFGAISLYWAKIFKPRIVEIGKILGHLTHTYIAFQSFDEEVLKNIKRSNIRTSQLREMIESLKEFSYGARTDLLVGLPGETYQSHLNSLQTALSMGLNHIMGGEIEMLPGTEMDSERCRKEYAIQTKYCLMEGCYGVYKGQFIYETQEKIRQTNTMTEKEMLRLRAVRAFFFSSVTLGEHLPLVSYLTSKNVSFTNICEEMVEEGKKNPIFKKSVVWLIEQSLQEFHSSLKDVEHYVTNSTNQEALINNNQFIKLNFGFLATIYLDKKQYEAYYQVLERVVLQIMSSCNPKIISELLLLCKERNYLIRCMSGKDDLSLTLDFSTDTMNALVEAGFITTEDKFLNPNSLSFSIDNLTAMNIQDMVKNNSKMTTLSLSQMLILKPGRFVMKPILAKQTHPISS